MCDEAKMNWKPCWTVYDGRREVAAGVLKMAGATLGKHAPRQNLGEVGGEQNRLPRNWTTNLNSHSQKLQAFLRSPRCRWLPRRRRITSPQPHCRPPNQSLPNVVRLHCFADAVRNGLKILW